MSSRDFIRTSSNRNNATPNLYDCVDNCCGCSACSIICPISAITMMSDKEGFFYPRIDEKKCICCYRCVAVCAFKEDQKEKGYLIPSEDGDR